MSRYRRGDPNFLVVKYTDGRGDRTVLRRDLFTIPDHWSNIRFSRINTDELDFCDAAQKKEESGGTASNTGEPK